MQNHPNHHNFNSALVIKNHQWTRIQPNKKTNRYYNLNTAPFEYSNLFIPPEYSDHFNDCAIRTIAVITGMSYDESLKKILSVSRKSEWENDGSTDFHVIACLPSDFSIPDEYFGYHSICPYASLTEIASIVPIGIVAVRSRLNKKYHVFPLIDGCFYDHTKNSMDDVRNNRSFVTDVFYPNLSSCGMQKLIVKAKNAFKINGVKPVRASMGDKKQHPQLNHNNPLSNP